MNTSPLFWKDFSASLSDHPPSNPAVLLLLPCPAIPCHCPPYDREFPSPPVCSSLAQGICLRAAVTLSSFSFTRDLWRECSFITLGCHFTICKWWDVWDWGHTPYWNQHLQWLEWSVLNGFLEKCRCFGVLVEEQWIMLNALLKTLIASTVIWMDWKVQESHACLTKMNILTLHEN